MNAPKKGFRNPMEFVQGATEQGSATRPVNLRMDEALFWEISDFSKLSGISFKDVVEGGARVELARLKKERGME
jgi:hypothetical protein